MRVTVFAPDDLQLVKGGPAGGATTSTTCWWRSRRATRRPGPTTSGCCKQRNALLRGGLRGDDAASTLEVFDAAARGGRRRARPRAPAAARAAGAGGRATAYAELAGAAHADRRTAYEAEWAADRPRRPDVDLEAALLDAFASTPQRPRSTAGITLVGPHRDEWRLRVGGLESRTHASQGEQRTLALALRLGGHRLCAELTGSAPVLLLDDVFSELDDQRAVALVAHLDAGQTLVTTAGTVPRGDRAPTACCASTPAACEEAA